MKPNANTDRNSKTQIDRNKSPQTEEKKAINESKKEETSKHKSANKWKKKKKMSKVGETGKYSHNDISWYVENDNIVKALGSVPFNWFPGMPRSLVSSFDYVSFGDNNTPSYSIFIPANIKETRMPSVMRLGYHPIAGTSDSQLSSLNVAARALYTYVRDKNSGAKNYEAPDLLMYILAMDQIYLMYHEARRAYQILNTYVTTNRWFPTALARAIRLPVSTLNDANGNNGASSGLFTYDNSGLAEYRARLNLLQNKISSLVVPNVFNIFKRRAYLASNIFSDDDAASGQFYIFDADSYGYWDPTVTTGTTINYKTKVTSATISGPAGSMENNVTCYRTQTLDQIIKRLEFAVGNVMADQDFGVIGGDLLKAFGDTELYKLTPIETGEQVSVVYDENTLSQIKNATFWGDSSYDAYVEQNGNTNTSRYASDNTAIWPVIPGLKSTRFTIGGGATASAYLTSPAAKYVNSTSIVGNVNSLATWQSNGAIYCTPMFMPINISDIYSAAPNKYVWPNGTSVLGSPTMFPEVCLYNYKHSDDMTPVEVVEATRLCGVYDKSYLTLRDWTAPWLNLVFAGSELMTTATIVNSDNVIYSESESTTSRTPLIGIPMNQVVTTDEPNFGLDSVRLGAYTQQGKQCKLKAWTGDLSGGAWLPFSHRDLEDQYTGFQWAPMLYNINGSYSEQGLVAPTTGNTVFTTTTVSRSGTYPVYPRGAYTNMTTVAKGAVRSIHDVAIQGLFATQIINKL